VMYRLHFNLDPYSSSNIYNLVFLLVGVLGTSLSVAYMRFLYRRNVFFRDRLRKVQRFERLLMDKNLMQEEIWLDTPMGKKWKGRGNPGFNIGILIPFLTLAAVTVFWAVYWVYSLIV
ncbi:MAG: hypothetical protein JSV43_00490, partial [Methanobacteriota archaeon]